MYLDHIKPVLVSEDTIYRREDHAKRLLLYGRPATTGVGQPFFLLSFKRPPPELFFDRFASVYPVIEFVSQTGTPNPQPWLAYQTKPNRVEDLPQEDQLRRINQQGLFSFIHGLGLPAPDVFTYTFTIPDLCDDPWLEQVHRPPNPESALFPFRQFYVSIPSGQTTVQIFYKGTPLQVEAETYTVPPELASKLYPFRQIYVAQPLPAYVFPPITSAWTADSASVTADTINFTADGADLIAGGATPIHAGGGPSPDVGVPLFVPVYGSSSPTTPLPVTYPPVTYYINGVPKKSGQ